MLRVPKFLLVLAPPSSLAIVAAGPGRILGEVLGAVLGEVLGAVLGRVVKGFGRGFGRGFGHGFWARFRQWSVQCHGQSKSLVRLGRVSSKSLVCLGLRPSRASSVQGSWKQPPMMHASLG